MKFLYKLLFLLACFSYSYFSHANDKPNVVIFYVDDLGYGDLASYGHPVVETPNIDQLAKEGLSFTQFYSPAPLCSPSRAGLLTGRTPYRTGVRSWIPHGQNTFLGENEITIANILKEQGYQTAITGKLHLNGGIEMTDQPQPWDMGFDYSFVISEGFVNNQKLENSESRPREGKMYPDNFYRNGKPVGATEKYSAELVADEAIHWLKNRDTESSFFLYVPFTEVHTPVASPEKYRRQYEKFLTGYAKAHPDTFYLDWKNLPYRGFAEYYANISFMDAQLGRIVQVLDESGLRNNTIIIFSSDNGPVTREARKPWELNMAGETNGLRGRKDNLFEGGIRVPGIVVYPPLIDGGGTTTQPATALDIMPTLAEIIGYDLPDNRIIDGVSITASFRGDKIRRSKPLIWTIDMPKQDDAVNEWAIRSGDWKLILDRQEQPKYLFNLADDYAEVHNLIDKDIKVLDSLMKEFEAYKISIETDSLKAARSH